MRILNLSKTGLNKISSRQLELRVSDFEDPIKSIPPGEWCGLRLSPNEALIAYLNPLVEDKFICAYVIEKIQSAKIEEFNVENFIHQKIDYAFRKRQRFKGYEKNSRLFYGSSDGLPGLIVDIFENASIIQINTAGLDKYRNKIKESVEKITGQKAYLLDNSKYREKESLPYFEQTDLPELTIIENGLNYKIRPEVLQKVGFYFDHRENRFQLMNLISRMNTKFEKGLDLFCYAGAWGACALKAGLSTCEFVDQGDFAVEVSQSLVLNQLKERGTFHRQDVFKYLDERIQKQNNYDLILCDPPAFAKSSGHKEQALEGYSKLHRKVLRVSNKNALLAFSSCTHYVTNDEFQKNIIEAAKKEGRSLQMIYSGLQGYDHPINSHSDRSNYIKSYFYIVE